MSTIIGVMLAMLTLAFGSGTQQASQSPPVDTVAIYRVVSSQLAVERYVLGREVRNDSPNEPLKLEQLDFGRNLPASFYRVTPWAISHWHPYIVAVKDSTILRLGGFTTSDVTALGEGMLVDVAEDRSVWNTVEVLVNALDPNGAHQLVLPRLGLASDSTVVSAWREQQEPWWPVDSLVRLPDGRIQVVLTVLSRAEHIPVRPWHPMVYAFEFDAHGTLLAWATRKGDPWAETRDS